MPNNHNGIAIGLAELICDRTNPRFLLKVFGEHKLYRAYDDPNKACEIEISKVGKKYFLSQSWDGDELYEEPFTDRQTAEMMALSLYLKQFQNKKLHDNKDSTFS